MSHVAKRLERYIDAIEKIASAIDPDTETPMKLSEVVDEALKLIELGRSANRTASPPSPEFDWSYHRFDVVRESLGLIPDEFPPHIHLKRGQTFMGTGRRSGIRMCVYGYQSKRPTYSVVAVPVRLLADPNYQFRYGDVTCFRTSCVVMKVHGTTLPLRKMNFARHRERYNLWAAAMTNPFTMNISGVKRRVVVEDINPRCVYPVSISWIDSTTGRKRIKPVYEKSIKKSGWDVAREFCKMRAVAMYIHEAALSKQMKPGGRLMLADMKEFECEWVEKV